MKRLVLVRHGESRWNAERRVQGQSCAGLSEIGHAQARVTAAALLAAHPDAALVSSDIQRTQQTAMPLAAELGLELGVDARTDERLRERRFGTWEGRTPDDLALADASRWARWRGGEDVVGEVGGETREQLTARVVPVFQELLEGTPEHGTTIVITHGGPIWHGTHGLLGLPPGTLGGLANTSVTELVCATSAPAAAGQPVPVVLDRWNDVGHLPVELRTAWQPRVAASSPAVVGP